MTHTKWKAVNKEDRQAHYYFLYFFFKQQKIHKHIGFYTANRSSDIITSKLDDVVVIFLNIYALFEFFYRYLLTSLFCYLFFSLGFALIPNNSTFILMADGVILKKKQIWIFYIICY